MGDQTEVEQQFRLQPRKPQRSGRKRLRAFWRWLKRGVLLLAAAGVVGLIVQASLPKPLPVDVVNLGRGPMQVTIDEDGRARVRDRYTVSAPLRCRVSRITLDPGDSLNQGDVIAYLSPLDSPILDDRATATAEAHVQAATAAKEQAAAEIDGAQAALAFADSNVERMKTLRTQSTVPQQVLDQAVMEQRKAAADLESRRFAALVADHELRMARATLDRGEKGEAPMQVTAPVSGRVLRVMQESEGVVEAGTPLLEIGDPDGLEVVVDVLTSDAVTIAPGAKVRIDRWGGPPLAATVRSIEPSAFTRLSALGVEEQRVNVIIDLDSPREEWLSLGDGYRVEASIVVWKSDDVLLVPASAVFRHGKEWAVYRVTQGQVALTVIQIDHRNAALVEVTSGLELPARVIPQPSDRVRDGILVVPRREEHR